MTKKDSKSIKTIFSFLLFLLFHVCILQEGIAASSRTITDMAGRSVTIDGKVNRVVTTFKPATLCLLSLGLQNKLVGVDSSSKRDKLSIAVFPGIKRLIGVGSKSMGLNYEAILSLNPDLVILYAQKDGKELAKQFERLKIPSIIILPENFSLIKTTLKLIAKAVGSKGDAYIAIEPMDNMISLVKNQLSSLSDEKKKTAYFSSARGLYSTATGNMLQDEMLDKAGLINVAHDLKGYFQDVSPEQFISWDPEIVLLSQHLKSSAIRDLASPSIKNVSAIKNKLVYRSPSSLAPWDFPSPLSALGVLWLAEKAYPELFSQIDLQKEINNFHIKLFGKSLEAMGGTLNDQIYKR